MSVSAIKIHPPSSLISIHGYDLLVSSDRLRMALLPDGLFTSPYEVLDYQATLVLHDAKGRKATFSRKQDIRFLHSGVSAILEHVWGDGLMLDYSNDAGPVVDSIRDGKYRHMVVDLVHPVTKGSRLQFATHRTDLSMFVKDQESWEIVIDHPVRRFSQLIVFPPDRPCLEATLQDGEHTRNMDVSQLPEGRTSLLCEIPRARMNTPYTLRWNW